MNKLEHELNCIVSSPDTVDAWFAGGKFLKSVNPHRGRRYVHTSSSLKRTEMPGDDVPDTEHEIIFVSFVVLAGTSLAASGPTTTRFCNGACEDSLGSGARLKLLVLGGMKKLFLFCADGADSVLNKLAGEM